MSTIRFSDGVSIETSGPYRIIRERDGFYVTGNGFLCAVETRAEGESLVASLASTSSKEPPS